MRIANAARAAAPKAITAAPRNAAEKPPFSALARSAPSRASDADFDPATATIAASPIAEPTSWLVRCSSELSLRRPPGPFTPYDAPARLHYGRWSTQKLRQGGTARRSCVDDGRAHRATGLGVGARRVPASRMLIRPTWLVLATLTCACQSGPSPVPGPEPTPAHPAEFRANMRSHFEAAGEMQRAIVQGRLAEARELAGWLGQHYQDEREGWQSYAEELQIAARGVEVAQDVPTAGHQLGRLGRACSSCHEARGASVAFAVTTAPVDVAGPVAQMRRHQWAAARLWEGVIGPSDESWNAGARVMSTTRLDILVNPQGKPNAEVVELAERLRVRAASAIGFQNHDIRAALYGEIMVTCASCHAVLRSGPVVEAR